VHDHTPQEVAAGLAVHQQATDEVVGNLLRVAGQEGLGLGWEVLDGRCGSERGLRSNRSHAILLTPRRGRTILEVTTPRLLKKMSEEQLKAFLEAVKADAGLQEKLKAAADADAVVTIAKAAGFVISAEEVKRAQAEVSEEELEGVAGGNIYVPADDPT
jgi:predicted ribosomally synthesized peptide with nif11-like leader